jgi:hypothetical protein
VAAKLELAVGSMAMAFGIAIASRERWGGSVMRVEERAEDASFSKSSELGEVAVMRRYESHAALLTCARSAMTRPLLKVFKNVKEPILPQTHD